MANPAATKSFRSSANRLVMGLVELCQSQPLAEKWLLCPTLRVGYQWVEVAARQGTPIFNLHPKTVRGLALDLASGAGLGSAPKPRRLLSGRGGAILAERVLRRQRRRAELTYLDKLAEGGGMGRTLFRSLQAIRMAGLSASGLAADDFEVERKGADLLNLLKQFDLELRRHALVDYATVLREARKHLPAALAEPDGPWQQRLVIAPADLPLEKLERRLLAAFPADRHVELPVDDAFEAVGTFPFVECDLDLLRYLNAPANAPAPMHDGSVQIFRAYGEVNEVREVFRRCLASGQPLDQVEILVTDPATYVPLLYEVAATIDFTASGGMGVAAAGAGAGASGEEPVAALGVALPDDDSLAAPSLAIPLTFGEGIPARFSRPGRLLLGWLRWVQEGYPAAALVQLLRDGLLQLPSYADSAAYADAHPDMAASDGVGNDAQAPLAARWADTLAALRIGFRRDRYLPTLDAAVAATAARMEQGLILGADPDDDRSEADRRSELAEKLQSLSDLRRFVSDLLTLTPAPLPTPAPGGGASGGTDLERVGMGTIRGGVSALEVLRSAEALVRDWAMLAGPLDRDAQQRLQAEIADMRLWVELDPRSRLDGWEWLAEMVRTLAIAGSRPRPGSAHVASLAMGGHSGRTTTFLLGLDESRFPGTGLQDPLLLDSERARISADLARAGERVAHKIAELARLFARLRGTLTLSYSCVDLTDGRDRFPSPELLTVYRVISGVYEADESRMRTDLPPAASFAATDPAKPLHPGDWWLWRGCGAEQVANGDEVLAVAFPHLAEGIRAEAARTSEAVTEWDGYVPAAGRDLDPTRNHRHVMSSTALETLGKCPLQFFLRYGLKVPQPEYPLSADRWLSPTEHGQLLHEVFEHFLDHCIKAGAVPNRRDHEPVLQRILARTIDRYRTLYPVPSDQVFRRERDRIHLAAEIFLHEEERYCQETGRRPAYLEVALGCAPEAARPAAGTADDRAAVLPVLDSLGAVPVPLPDGRHFLARGRIDRIDIEPPLPGTAAAQSYLIWDYKTGSSGKYDAEDPFKQGRILQPILYLLMTQHRLRQVVDGQAVVTEFGFFFPDGAERGHRLPFTRQELRHGPKKLQQVCDVIAAGTFVPSDDDEHCSLCRFRPVCGNPLDRQVAMQAKLRNPQNRMLEPFRQLRGWGDPW